MEMSEMDRHNTLHKPSRVELPFSLNCEAESDSELAVLFEASPVTRWLQTSLAVPLARLGVYTGSVAVIVTASLLALYVG
ncbi:MAG: hypothetical protein NVSMB18_22700 [Acetobacteraceae bacterium]